MHKSYYTDLEESVNRLSNYIQNNSYKGHDPYDALLSPLFKLPFFSSNKLVRFGTQQVVKRFPLNLRGLLNVPKGYNPVTLGLCIQGYTYLIDAFPEKKDSYLNEITFLIQELENLVSEGYSGACWGYDFDWEARYTRIDAYTPTVVATGIITNALYECHKVTQNKKCAKLIISASDFVIKDLNRTWHKNTFCYSYSPNDRQTIYNASMKGVRLLAQAFSLTNRNDLLANAKPAVDFVVNQQQESGAFYYSDVAKWIDNYHTGYILDALSDFIQHFGIQEYENHLNKGAKFYFSNFIGNAGMPKFYHNNPFPADCTAGSQLILSLLNFNKLEEANTVANWMIKNMQREDGSYYFRKFKNYTIKTPFMRWSNAWMFAAMSKLMKANNTLSPTNKKSILLKATNMI